MTGQKNVLSDPDTLQNRRARLKTFTFSAGERERGIGINREPRSRETTVVVFFSSNIFIESFFCKEVLSAVRRLSTKRQNRG